MNLRDKNLLLSFLAMFIFSLIGMTFSSIHLNFFAPFLIICYYQKSYPKALQYSILSGCIIDLFSSPLRFGIHALNYSLTTACIYHQKRNLFADNLTTLPLMTFLFSFVSTIIQVILLFIFATPIALSFTFIFSDLLFMPAMDALFSFCWFILPNLFSQQRNHSRSL